MRIKMQGFIVFDFIKEYPQARDDLAKWAKEGKVKVEQTIVKGGLEASDTALRDLYKGVNTGKFGLLLSGVCAVWADGGIGKLLVEIKNPQELSKL